jgi:hypothetical protein
MSCKCIFTLFLCKCKKFGHVSVNYVHLHGIYTHTHTHTHTHTIIDTSTHNIGKYLCKWVNIIGK